MIRGTPKFNSVVIGELQASFLGSEPALTTKAAFVDLDTGKTHGWTTAPQWSKATLLKLRELKSAMEQDLGRVHLEGVTQVEENTEGPVISEENRGLAEYLHGIDAPQM